MACEGGRWQSGRFFRKGATPEEHRSAEPRAGNREKELGVRAEALVGTSGLRGWTVAEREFLTQRRNSGIIPERRAALIPGTGLLVRRSL